MFAMTQTPAISFKSSIGDARPFVAGRPISRLMRTSVVPLARGPSLKNKNNIAKVPSCGKESVFIIVSRTQGRWLTLYMRKAALQSLITEVVSV